MCSNSRRLRLPCVIWRRRHVVKTGVIIVMSSINQNSNQLVVDRFSFMLRQIFESWYLQSALRLCDIELYVCKLSSCRCAFIVDDLK